MTAYHMDFPCLLFEHVDSRFEGGGKGIFVCFQESEL